MRFFLKVAAVLACLVALVPVTASAIPVVCNEGGDAGALPAGAASCLGAIDQIQGQFGGGMMHADMYQISIPAGGGFSATTVGGANFDTQLFLFNAAGFGIAANDDSTGGRSTLPLGNALLSSLPGGIYYLAITHFDNDPLSAGGLIFPSTPFNGVFGPTGSGGGSPINGWSANINVDGGGQYTIFLTGTDDFSVTGEPIPEPGTLLLLGSGLVGMAVRRRRHNS